MRKDKFDKGRKVVEKEKRNTQFHMKRELNKKANKEGRKEGRKENMKRKPRKERTYLKSKEEAELCRMGSRRVPTNSTMNFDSV